MVDLAPFVHNGVTVSFRLAGPQPAGTLVELTDGGLNHYAVFVKSDGRLELRSKGIFAGYIRVQPTGPYHVYASMYDTSTTSTRFELALDGAVPGTKTKADRINATLITTLNVAGAVEDLAIWTHPDPLAPLLTTAEVAALAGGADPSTMHPEHLVWPEGNGNGGQLPTGLQFGTQTHCAQNMTPDVFGQLASTLPGVVFVRDELFWNGVYDDSTGNFSLLTKFATYLDALAVSGIGMLVELLWGHTVVTGDVFAIPRTAASRAKFCDYASWIIGEVKNRGVQVFGADLWNEISGSWPGVPGKNFGELTEAERDALADDYVLLAQEVKARLTADHPNVPLAGGADVALQMTWINRLLDRGIANHVDALVLHPYGTTGINTVRAALDGRGLQTLPIWATEYGAQDDQALMVRRAAEAFAAKAKMVVWYLAKPHGSFGVDAALLNADGSIRAGGSAYQHMATLLKGGSHVGTIDAGLGVTVQEFTGGAGRVLVAWANVDTAVTISNQDEVRDVSGAPIASPATLTNNPIFVLGAGAAIAVSGSATVLDFTAQFAQTQGVPWEYGLYDAAGTWVPMMWEPLNSRWEGAAQFEWIRSTAIHPARVDEWQTARAQVPAGRYRLVGRFKRGSTGGDGVDIRIRANGQIIASGFAGGGQERAYDFVADLPAGFLEIGVNQKASNASDATTVAIVVQESTAEPSTLPINLGSPAPPPGGTGWSGTLTVQGGLITDVTAAGLL